MNVFLTGGTGFIGSYIAMALVNEGHHVTILARNKDKIPAFHKLDQIQVIQGQLGDRDIIQKQLKSQDVCIHVALNYTKDTGYEVLEDDTLPTVWMADIAAKAGVKQFIYTSSAAVNDCVYMLPPELMEEHIKLVEVRSRRQPVTFYGATKAASELFLLAKSYQSDMRMNIVRPGYTFGNPVIEGAPTQPDTRFHDIIKNIVKNEPVTVTQYDGTQFIFGEDLAKLYIEILKSDVNRKIYFGLSKNFVSWETIAKEAVRLCGSTSQIIVEDKGLDPECTLFDVKDMKEDFNLEFDPWMHIVDHLNYYIQSEKKQI